MEEDQGSSGPGTKMKCEEASNGRETSKSVKALKPSGQSVSLNPGRPADQLTRVPLQPALALPPSTTEIAT